MSNNNSLLGMLMPSKSKKKDSKDNGLGKKTKISKIAQDIVPFIEAYDNGVFQVEPGVFTKTYRFEDISFKTKSDEEQQRIYEAYEKFLNTLVPKEDLFISVVNLKDSAEERADSIVTPLQGDDKDIYRKEMSQMIKEKMSTSNNNIRSEKYITLRIEAKSVDEAMSKLETSGADVTSEFKKITKQSLEPLSLAERLELINTIFNGNEPNYAFKHDTTGKVEIQLDEMAKQGLTIKDVICPEYVKFNGSNFEINDRFGQSMYFDGLANWLNSNFFTDLSSMSFEGVLTMHIQAMPQADAIKMIHNQSVNINAEVVEKKKHLEERGYSGDNLPADLKRAQEEVENLQDDLLDRDQKMFYMNINLIHFADTKEDIKKDGAVLKNIAAKYMCSVKTMMMQQERGLASSMPVGIDESYSKRLLTTESLGVFIPFDEVHQLDKGGFYYGINSINKSLIVYNRTKGQNYNGLVLGSSGSGKSFAAKREMVSVILNTDSDIFIIDPDGEYGRIAEAFDGSVIKIAPGNHIYINPFDLDIDTSHDSDFNPITMKTDFICGMLETMIGAGARLTPIQKSIVDRSVTQIYRPYLEHLNELPPDEHGFKKTIDRDQCPTMANLFDVLLSRPEPEAQQLALIMETYTTGTFDSFAHRTNVDTMNRIIVYDIKDAGTHMMELALKVTLNDVWNKMMENRRRDKWTWFYIDEFHLLLASPSTSEFLKTVWKRARKWQGVPTGITQNVEDLLASTEARAIINNSSFIYMMNQSAMDRNMLGELLNLTDIDKEFITNAEIGCGLIHTGRRSIPFRDEFPKNTKLYEIMSTSPTDEATAS